jgi:hypothetical protein
MKKVLLLAVVALFVMMPLASFAMTTISDSDLNAITAQEGVSIYLNSITVTGMNLTMSWGQQNSSPFTATAIGGSGAIANFGFDNGGFIGADISVGQIGVNGLLTIDVGTNVGSYDMASSSVKYGSTTSGQQNFAGGINLGLHNIGINVGTAGAKGVEMIVKVGTTESLSGTTAVNVGATTNVAGVAANNMTLGTAYISGLSTTVNGNIFISTH